MKLVVGVDGSRGGAAALRWALDLCEARSDPNDVVELVHVYGAHDLAMPLFAPTSVAPPGSYSVVQPSMTVTLEADAVAHRAELRDHYRYEAEQLLDGVLRDSGGAGRTRIVLTPLAGDDPGRALLDQATGADLIVVGARGQSRLRTALVGSVTTHCVHHAKTPVVVVPTPD